MPGSFNYGRLCRRADGLIGRFAQGPATLHFPTTVPDGHGGYQQQFEDAPVKAVRLSYDARYRAQAGIPDSDVRVLVSRLGMARDLTLDCQITVDGERFRIVPPIQRDPADAMYDLQARPV